MQATRCIWQTAVPPIAGKPHSHNPRAIYPCGSELARDAGNALHLANRSDPIAGKPGSHNPRAISSCGSGLARDAGNTVHLAHRSAPIAGKPGSHNPGSHTVVALPAPGPIDSPRWPHSLVTDMQYYC